MLTCYITTDHLGSTRVVTDENAAVTARHDFLPFGEELTTSNRTAALGYGAYDNVMHKYTGQERDTEGPGLDFFHARYFHGAQGRFTSADNFLSDTTSRDPQSWDLYAYARNNPFRYVDPTGDKIYAGDLSDDDADQLVAQLDFTYGCSGCASIGDDGYIAVDTSGVDKNVAKAAQFLTDAINSTTFFAKVEVSNNDPAIAFGQSRLGGATVEWNGKRLRADLIRLDFGDDKWAGGDKAARETFLNTVFAHEVAHLFPQFQRDPTTKGPTGPVVDAVNKITDALGLPRRTGYVSSPLGGQWLSLPYSESTLDKHGQPKEKNVQVEWLKRNVGGAGVN